MLSKYAQHLIIEHGKQYWIHIKSEQLYLLSLESQGLTDIFSEYRSFSEYASVLMEGNLSIR